MRFVEFKNLLKNFTIFSLSDIRSIDKNFHRRRLNEWKAKGYIRKVIRGYYIFSDLEIGERVLFEIANRIYSPSYVSLETAFSYYNLIPESVYGITSISTRRTYNFETSIASFFYRTLKPKFFFSYDLVSYMEKCFKIASIEKCILDYFYLNSGFRSRSDFESLRIDRDDFFSSVDKESLFDHLEKFNSKRLNKRVEMFWNFMENA